MYRSLDIPCTNVDTFISGLTAAILNHVQALATVVRTTCCSYGTGNILHLSRAETTVPINTKFWTIDNLGEISRIAKFGYDRF